MVKELSAELEKLNVAQAERVADKNQLVTDKDQLVTDENQLITDENELVTDNTTDIDTDLSDLAVDLLVLAQELIEAKVRLEEMTKVKHFFNLNNSLKNIILYTRKLEYKHFTPVF